MTATVGLVSLLAKNWDF